ncbi:LLM class flavin-dependent oxidoreductase [Primorskyibacter aestuariivivens]|uniref:MupA/Atu3671 family FMN-dependent luciferase-like monooxygenase n=1 Tax=Primorskyibacter aestuariivivens TaxID=1888912 RepID=UPI0023016008|nr:MupA/Atu3671 family FMN-dependent luciferase-like monooxygenase [Primorskyibacter aestuariivivens]MDA7429895.1 LLM class flavin-dependent oxidoreductase [Primorskyibacter aestuariivivens]
MTRLSALIIGNESLARECAQQWLDRGHGIAAFVTRNPVLADWAREAGLRVEAPGADLSGLPCDWLLSIANLDILHDDLLSLPTKGAVNFHDGPLPRYAGLNAPVWALMAGETQHGITWHLIEGGVDEGDILIQHPVAITPEDTAFSLNAKCYAAGIESFPALMDELEAVLPGRRAQDLRQRSYFDLTKRPEAGGVLRLDRPAEALARMVRALDHGDYANPLCLPKLLTDRMVVIGAAELAEDQGTPGQVIAGDASTLTVACGAGALRLSNLQEMDGTPVDISAITENASLPLLSDTEAQALQDHAQTLARSETRWRARLNDMQPLSAPSAQTGETGQGRVTLTWPDRLDQQARADLVAHWAAQAVGEETGDIALAQGSDALASTWTPHRAGAPLPKTSFAADLPHRLGQPIQRPAISFGDMPGAAICVNDDSLTYDRALVPDAMAQILAARLEAMAEAQAKGDEPPRMPEAERDLVLHGWNDTARDYDRSATLQSLFEAQVAATPDATALVVGHDTLSYADLNARANQTAHVLRTMGVGRGTLVGLCTHRNANLIIGALAILKAGGAYVPMDPAYPAERLALFARDSGAAVVLTEAALAETLPQSQARTLVIDREAVIEAADTANPAPQATPEDLAYLIYTSGSTGRPKGVMVEHRNVVNFFAGMDDRIGRDIPGTWLAVTSLSFDISVLELFYSLARGYKLVLVNEEDKLEAAAAPVGGEMEFSLYYWGNDDGVGRDKYLTLIEGAKFADEHGFCAIWTPERHFHAFGGPYPNPSVTGAAVAGVTRNIGVRAGSCVAPLHHTARIAEEWAVIDNLTNGRAGLAIASGWQPDDFVLRPENTPPENKPAMLRQIEELRRLWAGETVDYAKADGTRHGVVTQPRPVSKKLPIWVTTAGNPATWKEAGKIGANVLTHLLGQSIDEVKDKIALYHDALRAAGHAPDDFTVTLMLHTCVAATRDEAREIAREPMKSYLRSAAGLIKQYAWAFPAFKRPEGVNNAFDLSLDGLSDDELDAILDFAFQRYFDDSGLFGTVEDCIARVEEVRAIGVTEVACLIDYGIPAAQVLDGLCPLAEVVAHFGGQDSGDTSIAAQIKRHKVTHLQCTPSMARLLMMSEDTAKALKPVEQLMLGGEPLSGALVDELRALTDAKIETMYGPTETTIWSSTGPRTGGGAICDIGTPISNTQMYVLDDAMQPVPVGVAGELYIGGDGVTRGYWQRDDLTSERFLPNPFAPGRIYRTGDLVRWRGDGRIDFIGRADSQVKLRGYRIELGEIEARLEAMEGVDQAVVVVQNDALSAFVKGRATAATLRAALARDVPEFMVPSRFDTVTEFPLTPNKKVDRKALAERPVAAPKPVVAPVAAPTGHSVDTSELRTQIAAIWTRILGVADITPTSNFFDLGGHSLLAVQAHREMRKALGLTKLSITDVFGYPTLDGLAKRIAEIGGPRKAPQKRRDEPVTVAAPAPANSITPPQSAPANPRAEARRDAMARRREMRARRKI